MNYRKNTNVPSQSEPVKILATRCSNHDQHFTVGCDIQLLRLLFNMILESKIMYMEFGRWTLLHTFHCM